MNAQTTQQLEPQQIEAALKPWIVETSREAAATGRPWTAEDHEQLLRAFQRVDELAASITAWWAGRKGTGRQG